METRPKAESLLAKVEMPLDFMRLNDSENVIGYEVKDMVIEFEKELEDVQENNLACYEQKILVGACKLLDSKLEKAVNFDIQIHVKKFV